MLSRKASISCIVASILLAGCGAKSAPSSSGASTTRSADGASATSALHIGASLSLTGSLAKEGQLTKEGYEACQTAVNAKGGANVGGKMLKVQIDYQDDTSQPDTAAQIVDQFNDKGVKLILSSYGSAATQAQAPVVERNGQVMADSAGSDNAIFSKGYKRTFAVLSPATSYVASMVQAIDAEASPKPKTIAFLSADDGFSKSATAGGVAMAQKLGYTVLPTEFFPNGTSDVSAALTKIKGEHPDVILESGHLVEGVALVKQAKELGITPSGGIGETVAPPTPDFVSTLGPLAENVLGSSQWSADIAGSDQYFGTAAQYAAQIKTTFKHDADYHNAEASAACLALVLAAEKAGSVDADKVRDAMSALDAQSFFGQIKFDSTGENIYKPMVVIQIQHGLSVRVWPKDNATASLNWPKTP